jgi:hypothetical protein
MSPRERGRVDCICGRALYLLAPPPRSRAKALSVYKKNS